ncbi:TIGR03088 family PEP-CTERM/XrtA system glycosyltransferase [Colwellia sp. MEBiC06753]
MSKQVVHIAHVVYSFATGGLENGVVNLINQLPQDQYRHSIICITDHDIEFIKRIHTDNYQIFNLHKAPGRGVGWLYRCWKLLRRLKPDICHSRNLNPLEAQIAAFLAGIKFRIHGEHGWDTSDIGGTNVKYQKLRKLFKPLITSYVALSSEAKEYLINKIQVPADKINQICNGVDIKKFNTERLNPEQSNGENNSADQIKAILPEGFIAKDSVVFGTVGRLAAIKNQGFLLASFIALKQSKSVGSEKAKLIIVGDGALMAELTEQAHASGFIQDIWFTGMRSDIPELMAAMDVFILPSLAEGISNTILEAMASGLPVIATKVGGNSDLIMPEHQQSHLVTVNDIDALKAAMLMYCHDSHRVAADSQLVRAHCIENFSIEAMVGKYHRLYQTFSQNNG